jgi:hypothetical protein
MMNVLIGIFIGIIIGSFGIIIPIVTRRNKERRKIIKAEGHYVLEPLVWLLIDNKIIKDGTRYLEDINEKYIYVFMEKELKQYGYKNNDGNDFFEINSINIPENIIDILKDYIMWNTTYGLNSMYARFIRFNHQIKRKIKWWHFW